MIARLPARAASAVVKKGLIANFNCFYIMGVENGSSSRSKGEGRSASR